jgi:hypothetical protein
MNSDAVTYVVLFPLVLTSNAADRTSQRKLDDTLAAKAVLVQNLEKASDVNLHQNVDNYFSSGEFGRVYSRNKHCGRAQY